MENYENRLIRAFFYDSKIYHTNRSHFDLASLFENKYNKYILSIIDEYNDENEGFPSKEALYDIVQRDSTSTGLKIILDHLELNIFSIELDNAELNYIQNRIPQQIKERLIERTHAKLDKITNEEMESSLEQIYKLTQTQKNFEIRNLWDDISVHERVLIPTKLELIDEYGMGKGELGILLAGTGVGKSVFLSFLANNIMLGGYKVLHIVFEGNIDQYQKAHLTKLNTPPSDELKGNFKYHNLKIVKMRANQTSVKDIEELIKTCIIDGFVPDCLVIDYVDCIVINNRKEGWVNDITIINELEHLAQKYQIGIWTAVQANRSGINKELGLENSSGSISKVQKATMVLALTRDEFQQEQNRANVRVLKNRFGISRASINCLWNPKEMKIELPITREHLLG